MRKFELSLAPDYVGDWTVIDAVRELFQNALDQQAQVDGNTMFFDYNDSTETLRIGNKLSVLEPSTLLLGATTKRDDKDTIGQFGEGYKVAALVLTREGKTIRFLNYGRKELWTARFVKSRKYGTEVLTFFVDKEFKFTKAPDNNLTIEIEGITTEEYEQVVERNLWLQPGYTSISTEYGHILTDEQHKHKVFVNGLYVCDHEKYTYGYDFKPQHIDLNRDRKLVSDFSLHYLASKMWLDKDNAQVAELAVELVEKNAADVEYVRDVWNAEAVAMQKRIAQRSFERFRKQHGPLAVPVSSNDEIKGLSKEYTPVIVSEVHKRTITASPDYVAPIKEVIKTPTQKLRDLFDKHLSYLIDVAEVGVIEELEEILDELEQQEGN